MGDGKIIICSRCANSIYVEEEAISICLNCGNAVYSEGEYV